MKKTSGIYFLFAFLFLFSKNSIAQCDGPLVSSIGDSEAQARLDLFYSLKLRIYESEKISASLAPISVDKVKNLLTQLKDLNIHTNPNSYDGVRIYFLVTDADANGFTSLTIAVVPTMADAANIDSCKTPRSRDDKAHAFILKDGSFTSAIDITNTSHYFYTWKASYERMAAKIDNAVFNKAYKETRSIWYSKEMLYYPQGVRKLDLLTFLESCTRVTDIVIQPGCWLFEEQYQDSCTNYFQKTDLLFQINGIGSKKFITLEGLEIKNKFNEYKLLSMDKSLLKQSPFATKEKMFTYQSLFSGLAPLPSGYTDTGLPCPPNKCN